MTMKIERLGGTKLNLGVGGFTTAGILTVLKLLGIVNFSWVWVFAPIWGLPIVFILGVGTLLVGLVLSVLIFNLKVSK